MSTFSFPINPADGEIFVLPDGNEVQWNSYAWVPVTETVTYPLEIALGGTSAATVPEAQTNLVIGLTTINDDPPATPKYGDRWIRPEDMVEFVWVPNANTAGNWISPFDTSSSGGGSEITYPITVALGGTGADTPQQALTNLGGVGEAPAGPIIYGRNNGIWVEIPSGGSGVSVGDTPPVDPVQFPLWWDSTNLQLFVWYEDADSSQWVVANSTPGGSSGIEDAPIDGKQYGRKDATWTEITGGGANGGVFIGDIPPTDPAQYPLWWDSTNLHLFIWYDDGTSAQWVDTTPGSSGGSGGDTSGFVLKTGDTMTGPLLLPDGTVVAPAMAFASEPGLGFYCSATGIIRMASGGNDAVVFSAGTPISTSIVITPRQAAGASVLELRNNNTGTVDYNVLGITQNPDGSATINTAAQGTAVRGTLTLDAPATTVTGTLTANNTVSINAPDPYFILNKAGSTSNNYVMGMSNGVPRWYLTLGNGTAESGGNAGSDLIITRMSDTGEWLSDPLTIDRATGIVTAQGLTTTVETAILQASLDAVIEETTARADRLQIDLDEIKLHADELQAIVDDLKSSLHSALARIAALEKKK
jgi:hypothetical protein